MGCADRAAGWYHGRMSKPCSKGRFGTPRNLSAKRSAWQFWQPGLTLVQPVTGFQLALAHSMLEAVLTSCFCGMRGNEGCGGVDEFSSCPDPWTLYPRQCTICGSHTLPQIVDSEDRPLCRVGRSSSLKSSPAPCAVGQARAPDFRTRTARTARRRPSVSARAPPAASGGGGSGPGS